MAPLRTRRRRRGGAASSDFLHENWLKVQTLVAKKESEKHVADFSIAGDVRTALRARGMNAYTIFSLVWNEVDTFCCVGDDNKVPLQIQSLTFYHTAERKSPS